MKAEFWKILDDIESEAGQEAVEVARARIAAFENHYAGVYPAAVKWLITDVASLTATCGWPRSNGSASASRSSNRAHLRRDPTSGQGIGHLPGERSRLSLVWAVLDWASKGRRGVKRSPTTTRLLADQSNVVVRGADGVVAPIAPNESEEGAVTADV